MKQCYYCFEEFEDEYEICPYCGHEHKTAPKEAVYLPPGTILKDKYIIGEAIGQGGFGIVYRAYNKELKIIVAIKEFFASRLVNRAPGHKELIVSKREKIRDEFEFRKDRFLVEAQTLADLGNHRNVPNVYEFFEENNTAYIAMELLSGQALNKYIAENNGIVSPDFAVFVANEVGSALKAMHAKGIIHRDVAPDNIYLCADKEITVKLIDLGSARLGNKTDDYIDLVEKPGYSPAEQYDATSKIGTFSDVYALGATMYRMLTGVKPDESTNRKIEDKVVDARELNPEIPVNLSNAIMRAMAIEAHMRFQTVDEFLKAINGKGKVLSVSEERARRRKKRIIQVTLASLALVAAIIAGILTYLDKRSDGYLKPATIDVWFCEADGSTEERALESIKADFESNFPDVTINLVSYDEEEYAAELEKAMNSETGLPTLFESTDVSDELLVNAHDLKNIVRSKQFKNCLFVDQYSTYYKDQKRVPLGIIIPMAYIITSGDESVSYTNKFFTDITDFDYNKIALDERYASLIEENIGDRVEFAPRADFFNNEKNKSAVLLSTSMAMSEVRQELTNYTKVNVFLDKQEIICRYTYEWSIGNGTKEQIKAAERLLTWMYGNPYQTSLMSTRANDGQIPVNADCFADKLKLRNLEPLKDIYQKFVFRPEIKGNE